MRGFIRLSPFGQRALFTRGFQVCLRWALLYCFIAYVRLTQLCMLGLNCCLHWVETFVYIWMETILHLGFKPLFMLGLPKIVHVHGLSFGLKQPGFIRFNNHHCFHNFCPRSRRFFSIEQLILLGFSTVCSCWSIPTKGLSTLRLLLGTGLPRSS